MKRIAEMNIKERVQAMSLEEKLGQKIMLDFRCWNASAHVPIAMTQPEADIAAILLDHHIGGIILFADNLINKQQIATLTGWYAALKTAGAIRLFIATDNEGGAVFRLPRSDYASFPGNMALAAVQGCTEKKLAFEQGACMARDMLSLHINTNFAPVADVNSNPANPVINVRAFGDSVSQVTELAQQVAAGMQQQQLMVAYKHFPGHGDTATDSHTSLPRVNRSREDALAIDIAPYRQAIASATPPDMIMTAHIQYPALDNSLVTNQNGEKIIVPATMSREIQTVILRDQLGFQGVTVSDALNMGAIADNFNQQDALLKVFAAGVDIALMPVSVTSSQQAKNLTALIASVIKKVHEGVISEAEIDRSVERILALKQHYGLLADEKTSQGVDSNKGRELEKQIADGAITLVINKQAALPLKPTQRCFILTPAQEQGAGIAAVMAEQGYQVTAADFSSLNEANIRAQIARCDVFLFGTLSTSYTPVEASAERINAGGNGVSGWLNYAAEQHKKCVHLSLRAPYDIANYADRVDAALAVYSFYGLDNGVWRGPAMRSLAEILTGKREPQGRLPVTVWKEWDAATGSGTVAFPRGYGLGWEHQNKL